MSQENLQSNKPLIIYGPEGCGKTRYAQVLARHFGKEIIIDDWSGHNPKTATLDALYLTNEDLSDSNDSRPIPFHVAAKAAGIDISDHHTPDSDLQRRYCKDCIYCQDNMRWDPECSAPEAVVFDLVTGPRNRHCRQMRTDKRLCGSAGHFYVPRPIDSDGKRGES